jgi:hypothetical protein
MIKINQKQSESIIELAYALNDGGLNFTYFIRKAANILKFDEDIGDQAVDKWVENYGK